MKQLGCLTPFFKNASCCCTLFFSLKKTNVDENAMLDIIKSNIKGHKSRSRQISTVSQYASITSKFTFYTSELSLQKITVQTG